MTRVRHIERLADLAGEPVSGRSYMVPCVFVRRHPAGVNRQGLRRWKVRAGWVPVIGPKHEDLKLLGVPGDHWHLDWRFVTRRHLQLMLVVPADVDRNLAWNPFGKAIFTSVDEQVFAGSPKPGEPVEPVERRLRCRRLQPEFPPNYGHDSKRKPIPWMPRLEDQYAGCTLGENRVCPHRGMPLAGQPVRNGVVVCPGHGLAWNVETGCMVRRATPWKE